MLATAFTGVTEEHRIGHAFQEALPFTALVVVFFAIVAVIHEQHLFAPVVDWVLSLPLELQPAMFYVANGALSAISDNVFVATVYISEVAAALESGAIDRASVRRARHRDQHRHEHAERRDAERPSRVPVPIDVGTRAADPPVLPAHGVDGVAVYDHGHCNRASRRHLLAVRFPPIPALRTREKVRSKSSCEFCSLSAPDLRVDRGCTLGSNGPGAGFADGLPVWSGQLHTR